MKSFLILDPMMSLSGPKDPERDSRTYLHDGLYLMEMSENSLENRRIQKLVLSCDTSTLNPNDIDDIITGISTFIKPLVFEYYHLKIDDVSIVKRESNIVDFIPVMDLRCIYIRENLYQYIDLQTFVGYTFITTNHLFPYVVNVTRYLRESKKIQNFYCISNSDIHPWAQFLKDKILKLQTEGYISFEGIDDDTKNALGELAKLWRGDIIRYEDGIIIKSNINFDTTAESWYLTNSKNILKGKIPRYRLQFPLKKLKLSEVTEDTRNEDFVLAKYTSIVAYMKLTDIYDDLINFVGTLEIFADMTIEASFYTYEQVHQFQKLLSSSGGIPIDLTVSYVQDLQEALKIRYFLQHQRKDQQESFIVNFDQKLYLVTNESLDVNKIRELTSGIKADTDPQDLYQNYGYFSGNVFKGLKNYLEPKEIKVPTENIRRTQISQKGQFSTVSVSINQRDFLVANRDLYYLKSEEIDNLDLEIAVKDTTPIHSEEDQILTLYEGNTLDRDQIIKMWQQGVFWNPWSKYILKHYSKYSRLPVIN